MGELAKYEQGKFELGVWNPVAPCPLSVLLFQLDNCKKTCLANVSTRCSRLVLLTTVPFSYTFSLVCILNGVLYVVCTNCEHVP